MKGNMSQSRNAGAFENFVPKSRKINGQTLDNDVQIDNVASADKLKTSRTISLSGAVTSTPTAFDGSGDVDIPIIDIKEAYLDWGGKNRTNRLSPVDVAMLPELCANRLAFISNESVKFERSEDAGVSWYDVSDRFDGTMLCTDEILFTNGNTPSNLSVNRQHRITIDCITGGLYCYLSKILLFVNTDGAGGCKCVVEFGDNSEETVWTYVTDGSITGWTGWNTLNIGHILIGNSASYRYVRLTFSITSVVDGTSSDLIIKSVRFISDGFYKASNLLASKGVMYTLDKNQTVIFPKNLTIQGDTLKIGSTILTETQLKALLALLT